MKKKKNEEKINPLPVYIPYNVDVESLLVKHPINIANAKDKLNYLMSLIHSVPAYQKHDDIDDSNGYTILYSKYLESAVDEYAPLFNWLDAQGIVERKNHLRRVTSKGYRFTDEYCTALKKVFIKKKKFIEKIKAGKKIATNIPKLKPENLIDITADELDSHLSYADLVRQRLWYLSKWHTGELTIDAGLSEQFLIDRLNEDKETLTDRQAMNRFIRAKMIVDSFNNPDGRFLVDDTAGRLHTLLTCLKSPLRAFLSYAGKPLVSVDIKNSQPLLSLVLLDFQQFHKNKMLERIAIYNDKFRSENLGENNNSSYYIMLGNLLSSNALNPDLLKYKELVINGKLYEYFGEQLQELGIISRELSVDQVRATTKKAVLKCLFNRNQAIGHEPVQKAFQQVFPSVYEIFQLIKTGNHRTLACVLQNLEAEIVLHKACKEIAAINPMASLFTIHDSIASTAENIDLIKTVLSCNLHEVLGCTPTIETEPWDMEYLHKKKNKNIVIPLTNIDKNMIDSTVGYGYCDDEIYCIPLYPSLTDFAKENGFRRNLFIEGLRKLSIIQKSINLPAPEYEKARLLIPYTYTKKPKRSASKLNLSTTKITHEGCQFLMKVIHDHPELFPPKRVRLKKA